MLGRSYGVLGRSTRRCSHTAKPPSACRRTRASTPIGPRPSRRVQGRSLAGQPTELLERALALDPNNAKALALLGAAAVERNDRATAKALWTRLRATLAGGQPAASRDRYRCIAGLAERLLRRLRSASTSIEGRVEIDPKLAKSLAPTDTVFIFARDPDGPRMPLAAMKVAGADLPRTFALTDDDGDVAGGHDLQGGQDRGRGARQQIGRRKAAAGRSRRNERARGARRAGCAGHHRPRAAIAENSPRIRHLC